MTVNDPLDATNSLDDLLPTRPATPPPGFSAPPPRRPPRSKRPLIVVAIVVLGALLIFGHGCSGSSLSRPGDFIDFPGNGGGPTQCEDGSLSHSSGSGTCSWHGGVDD